MKHTGPWSSTETPVLVGHQMNEQVRHRASRPLKGILGTRSVGKPAMANVDVGTVVRASETPRACPASPRWPEVDLKARRCPKGQKRAHEFREGARHGDVVSATPFETLDCCVSRGVAKHQGPF